MKKILKLEFGDDESKEWMKRATYSSDYFEFAGVNGPDKDKVITLDYDTESCREALCEDFRDSEENGYPKIAKDKMRLIVYTRGPINSTKQRRKDFYDKTERRVACGVKILNVFEREVGWPLTRMYKLKADLPNRNVFFYVVGNYRWVKSPHLISLFTLLIRLGKSEITGFRSYNTLVEKLTDPRGGGGSDKNFFRKYHERWLLILQNYNQLFGKRSLEDLYAPAETYGNGYFNDGINSLCDCDTLDVKLRKAFSKLLESKKK